MGFLIRSIFTYVELEIKRAGEVGEGKALYSERIRRESTKLSSSIFTLWSKGSAHLSDTGVILLIIIITIIVNTNFY